MPLFSLKALVWHVGPCFCFHLDCWCGTWVHASIFNWSAGVAHGCMLLFPLGALVWHMGPCFCFHLERWCGTWVHASIFTWSAGVAHGSMLLFPSGALVWHLGPCFFTWSAGVACGSMLVFPPGPLVGLEYTDSADEAVGCLPDEAGAAAIRCIGTQSVSTVKSSLAHRV